MKKFLCAAILTFIAAWVFAQQKPVVAVAPFDAISGITTADANVITGVFYNRLGNTNVVTLVDRSVVERVIREHQFQLGDWSNTQKTAELGDALNADWIVRGEIARLGTNIIVNVQFYDINTFRFRGGADIPLANMNEAYDKMTPLVERLVQTIGGTYQSIPRGLIYDVADNQTVTITKYFGIAATLNIPSHIEGLPVTAIGYKAFDDCINLISVTIPSTVTTIGNYAFIYCHSLTSVTIPSSVTSIGNGAFNECRSLTSVTIPSSVISIGNEAFRYCRSLTSVTIPSSVTIIGWGAFSDCSSLTSVTLSRRTQVGSDTFPRNARITYRD